MTQKIDKNVEKLFMFMIIKSAKEFFDIDLNRISPQIVNFNRFRRMLNSLFVDRL